jgi:hypothetical protein
MARRRTKSELFAAGGVDAQAERWCSGRDHRCWLPKERFSLCREYGRRRYCRECAVEYTRQWRARRKAQRNAQRNAGWAQCAGDPLRICLTGTRSAFAVCTLIALVPKRPRRRAVPPEHNSPGP